MTTLARSSSQRSRSRSSRKISRRSFPRAVTCQTAPGCSRRSGRLTCRGCVRPPARSGPFGRGGFRGGIPPTTDLTPRLVQTQITEDLGVLLVHRQDGVAGGAVLRDGASVGALVAVVVAAEAAGEVL